ncbi:MAG: carboxypeptidase regulatory-like domain-containing protein [Janthinobacterium lividum]
MKKLLSCSSLALCLAASLVSGCKSKSAESAATPASTAPPSEPVFQVDPATAASIHGVVKYDGARPKPQVIDMSSDPLCVKAHKGKALDESLLVNGKGELGNAFVYIEKGLEGKHFAVPSTPVTIDQGGCWFRPRVVGIQVGQTLDVTNSDPVTHNIHPMATINREWNHSQGPGDPPMHRKFLKQEVAIPVKCNIHNWMHASIGVVDSPYFAVTKDDGSFDLPNLPPGTYTVTAWHETLGTQQATLTVPASGKGVADLTFHPK